MVGGRGLWGYSRALDGGNGGGLMVLTVGDGGPASAWGREAGMNHHGGQTILYQPTSLGHRREQAGEPVQGSSADIEEILTALASRGSNHSPSPEGGSGRGRLGVYRAESDVGGGYSRHSG